ncbi:uncharacterized protein [Anoplolepis gracilipes]|uniref:uncharacterized protein isoform X3 n=1 Tax=Anoplolepis gracilipes TaxID=354296 RepID=UPI003B9EF00E
MINVKDQYFGLNRTLLLIVGLWPYNKSKFTRFQFIGCFSILITFIIFQFTTFMTSQCTADLVIKTLSLTFGSIAFTIKYNSFYINSGTVKYLMEQLQQMCDDLKDNNEIVIVKKYGNYAKRYTIRFTMLVVTFIFILTFAQLKSDLYNVFLPVNKSRAHYIWIETEYFINQEKYFYLLILHIHASLCIGLLTLLATGTMLHAYLQYACGMFEIASYRIENTMKIYMSRRVNLQEKNLVCEGIIYAIDIHRKAIKFSEYLISNFEISFMLLIVSGVITLSLNVLQTLQILSSKLFKIEEFLMSLITAVTCLLYMFLSNLIGQEITNHYNHLFSVTYNVRWYMAPLYIQRLILLLLQRSNKTFGLNVGGLFVASLQCFATSCIRCSNKSKTIE